jgi:putative membrane protein
MMKKSKIINGWTLAIIASVFMFSFTACNNTEKETKVVEEPVVEQPASEVPVDNTNMDQNKLTDSQIASVAVVANQVDVNYGKIALKKSTNADVKKFAQTMITDHESIIKTAVDLVKKLGVNPNHDNSVSKSLLAGEKETTEKLNSFSGDDFNKAYIDNEVTYHEAVINAVKTVLIPQTVNTELKSTLESIVPLLEHHLEMAKMTQKSINK